MDIVYIAFFGYYSAVMAVTTFILITSSSHYSQPHTALGKIWKDGSVFTPQLLDTDILMLTLYVMYLIMLSVYVLVVPLSFSKYKLYFNKH